MNIISAGEILWDVFGEVEHLGGAPFNFAAHARRLGNDVVFISAVGDDEHGRRALARAAAFGLAPRWIRIVPGAATGAVTVTVDAGGQPSYVIHRPAAYDEADLDSGELASLSASSPAWIAFGTLHQMSAGARRLTARLIEACPGARRFYDVNLRVASYTPDLIEDLMTRASLVKLNAGELDEITTMRKEARRGMEQTCREWADRFGWDGICVTRGEDGSALLWHGEYVESPGHKVTVADAVGAGDAFSAALVHGLGAGWPPAQVAGFANRVGALVASRRGAIPDWTPEEVQDPAWSRGSF